MVKRHRTNKTIAQEINKKAPKTPYVCDFGAFLYTIQGSNSIDERFAFIYPSPAEQTNHRSCYNNHR